MGCGGGNCIEYRVGRRGSIVNRNSLLYRIIEIRIEPCMCRIDRILLDEGLTSVSIVDVYW